MKGPYDKDLVVVKSPYEKDLEVVKLLLRQGGVEVVVKGPYDKYDIACDSYKNPGCKQSHASRILIWFMLPLWLAANGGAIDFGVAGILQTWDAEILGDVAIEKHLLA